MQNLICHCLLLVSLFYLVSSTLENVHLIFRHGERCPDKRFMHPKDPYRNKTFAPYGTGQITNLGKEQVYNLGLAIRNRYQSLIGDSYHYNLVDPWSSALPRGQVSMMLILAGIFKPNDQEIWNDNLLWQPVPFKHIPNIADDDMFLSVITSTRYMAEYNTSFKKNGKLIMDRHKHTVQSIKELIQMDITSSKDAFTIYVTTSTENCVGYPIPEWFTSISNDLEKFATSDYQMQISTKNLQRLAVGKLLTKIVDDTKAKINNKTQYNLHLYSGHDFNVAHLLLMLGGVELSHVIPYAACLALEVHKHSENMYNIYIVYKEGLDSDWKTIAIQPFDWLQRMVEDLSVTQTRASSNLHSVHMSYLFLSTIFTCLLYV